MIIIEELSSFIELVILCLKLDTCIRATEGHTQKPPGSNPNPKPPSTVSGTYAGPIDLSGTKKRGKISATERTRRFRKGAYIYYRKQGHFARDCPEAPKNLIGNRATLTEVDEEAGKE